MPLSPKEYGTDLRNLNNVRLTRTGGVKPLQKEKKK